VQVLSEVYGLVIASILNRTLYLVAEYDYNTVVLLSFSTISFDIKRVSIPLFRYINTCDCSIRLTAILQYIKAM